MRDIFDLFRSIAPKPAGGPPTHLVVGLGNPGAEYEGTRHNVGFAAIDFFAREVGAQIDRSKFHALIGEAEVEGVRVLLMKPMTYMNLSGQAVREAMQFYRIPQKNVIVLCDDISFDVGMLRIRLKGSHGGHNGLKNIAAEIGSDAYPRLKLGVGKKPHPDYDLRDWVLSRLPEKERADFAALLPSVSAAVRLLLTDRAEEAMRLYSH